MGVNGQRRSYLYIWGDGITSERAGVWAWTMATAAEKACRADSRRRPWKETLYNPSFTAATLSVGPPPPFPPCENIILKKQN